MKCVKNVSAEIKCKLVKQCKARNQYTTDICWSRRDKFAPACKVSCYLRQLNILHMKKEKDNEYRHDTKKSWLSHWPKYPTSTTWYVGLQNHCLVSIFIHVTMLPVPVSWRVTAWHEDPQADDPKTHYNPSQILAGACLQNRMTMCHNSSYILCLSITLSWTPLRPPSWHQSAVPSSKGNHVTRQSPHVPDNTPLGS